MPEDCLLVPVEALVARITTTMTTKESVYLSSIQVIIHALTELKNLLIFPK